jgi:hypothetical protein
MKLLERMRNVAMQRRLARATIDCYLEWVESFLRFCRLPDGRLATTGGSRRVGGGGVLNPPGEGAAPERIERCLATVG